MNCGVNVVLCSDVASIQYWVCIYPVFDIDSIWYRCSIWCRGHFDDNKKHLTKSKLTMVSASHYHTVIKLERPDE